MRQRYGCHSRLGAYVCPKVYHKGNWKSWCLYNSDYDNDERHLYYSWELGDRNKNMSLHKVLSMLWNLRSVKLLYHSEMEFTAPCKHVQRSYSKFIKLQWNKTLTYPFVFIHWKLCCFKIYFTIVDNLGNLHNGFFIHWILQHKAFEIDSSHLLYKQLLCKVQITGWVWFQLQICQNY